MLAAHTYDNVTIQNGRDSIQRSIHILKVKGNDSVLLGSQLQHIYL